MQDYLLLLMCHNECLNGGLLASSGTLQHRTEGSLWRGLYFCIALWNPINFSHQIQEICQVVAHLEAEGVVASAEAEVEEASAREEVRALYQTCASIANSILKQGVVASNSPTDLLPLC